MGDAIVMPKGPTIEVVDQRLIILPTRVWNAQRELRDAAQTLPSVPGRVADHIAWTSQSTCTWTTVVTKSERHQHLRTLVVEWLRRGVYLLDLPLSAPRCLQCGCVDQIACGGGCAWAIHGAGAGAGAGSWLCSACVESIGRRGAR